MDFLRSPHAPAAPVGGSPLPRGRRDSGPHRIATGAALLVGALPVIVTTALYWQQLAERARNDARLQATLLQVRASAQPEAWARDPAALAAALQTVRDDASRTVVEHDGAQLIALGAELTPPALVRWSALPLPGGAVGRVGVSRSLSELLGPVALALAASGALTALLLTMLRRLFVAPLRASERARRIGEDRLDAIDSLSSDWFWEQDDDYRFTVSTQRAEHLPHGGETLGKRRWELPIRLSPQQWAAHRADLDARRRFALRYRVDGPEGARWHEVRGIPIFAADGRFAGYRGVGRDVTHEVEHARALAGDRDRLRQMVDEQTAELLRAKQAAEEASRAKSQFLATMSHELRTPLNGVLGLAQLLQAPDLPPAERDEYLRLVQASGNSLLSLLDDILDLSRIEAGRMAIEPRPCAPGEIVDEVAAQFARLASDKGVALRATWHGDDALYMIDPLRLRQMLSNLVNNAVKFTARGEIVVEAWECERVGRHAVLEFSVSDTGIGIAAPDRARIFEPFTQVDGSYSRRHGGTGLGLAIVSRLAASMGGWVDVESVERQGSRFWFRIGAERVGPQDTAGATAGGE